MGQRRRFRRGGSRNQFFFINSAVVATFLTKTGVGQIAIVEIAFAMGACVPAAIAWTTLKKSAISEIALLWAAFFVVLGLVIYPFNSHPVALEQAIAGLLSAIAHRLALAVWLGGLPVLILLIGAGPVADDTRQFAAVVIAPLLAARNRCYDRYPCQRRAVDLVFRP
jgi:putative copper resistance protein D